MDRTVVITGTTHGIGRVTALELARAGWRLVMLVRDTGAGARVRQEIVAAVAGARVEVVDCDLASLDSVRRAAARVAAAVPVIHCLINNAGMVSMHHRASADGFELVFATNHLGPFLLTELLRDRVALRGRIINVASRVHFKGSLDLGEVPFSSPRRFRPLAAYARSKLANVLHTFALARRLAERGIAVNCLHPGVVRTNLLPRWLRLIKPVVSPHMLDEVQGARTTLHLALDDGAGNLHGAYVDADQTVRPAAPLAQSVALQEALWHTSRVWVGLSK